MEYKYYRDLKHNYLVFEYGGSGNLQENKYQYKIVESGRVKGLVPCAERNINGERYYYYEVGSMQPINDRFSVSKMKYADLMSLIRDSRALLEELSEFLLGEEGVVFNTKCLYTDLATGGYKFVYCPFFNESMSFSDFVVELLDLVDSDDEKAMELAYLLCEKATVPGAMTLGILESVPAKKQEPVPGPLVQPQVLPVLPEAAMDDEDLDEDYRDAPPEGKRNSGMRKANRKLGGKAQLLLSLLFGVVLAGIVYVRMNYILTDEENVLSIIVMMISVITGVVAFVGGILDMKNRGEKPFSQKQPVKQKSSPEDSFDEEGPELYEDEELEEFRQMEDRNNFGNPIMVSGAGMPPERCSETMVLDETGRGELTLFSRNLDKTVRIGLGKLPVTIGKMEGCVDRVLNDASVSRIHCRLQQTDGRIFIEDLGSTNGTFKNGLKLSPREKTYIDEGDEIRIGRVCFDCR